MGYTKVFFLLNLGMEFWHNDDGLYCGFLLISFGEFPARVMCFWSFKLGMERMSILLATVECQVCYYYVII